MKKDTVKVYSGLRVLLMEASSRQVLPMAKGFKNLGCEVTVACGTRMDLGNNTKYADKKIVINGIDSDDNVALKEYDAIISSRNYDLIVPLSDFSAKIAADNKEKWVNEYKTHVAVNDYTTFMKAFDKLQTMKICMENGIPCPRTVLVEDVSELDNIDLTYPLVVKPRSSCGSIGFNIVSDRQQLICAVKNTDNGPVLIQEYIPQNGPQYGGEVFRDKNGKYPSLIIDEKPRWFPLDGGSPTINVTIHDEKMKDSCVRLLNAMDWNGYANIDFVVDSRTGEAKIIEVNGRISAGVKLNYFAGVDVAKMIIENEFKDTITAYNNYKDGLKTSCILTEILWFLKSKNRFENKPSFLNRKNTRDVIFSWSDMKPFFAFCIQSTKNYKHSMELRKRLK